MVMVAVAALAYLAALSRGWYKKDEAGRPVIEEITWLPARSEDLGPHWEKVRSQYDNDPRLLGRAIEIEAYVVIGGVMVLVPVALLWGLPDFGLAGLFVLMAFASFRLASMGLYVSKRGVKIIGLRSRFISWSDVDHWEIRPRGEGEQIAVATRLGRLISVWDFTRERTYATERWPVGPGRWKLHAFEQLVAQLNHMTEDVARGN